MSLTPGLSTHGFFNSQIVNTFSLNLIGGATAGVDGTELAGGFNVNQYDMRGAQFAGVINVVGECERISAGWRRQCGDE